MHRFVKKKEIIKGFADAMNLISPEVQDHHEKVAYISYQLADIMGMKEEEKQLALFGALLHDIGGVLQQGEISLIDLELNARQVALMGAEILQMYAFTQPYAGAVEYSQTPWERWKREPQEMKLPQQLGAIVHLADVISLLFSGEGSALNQAAAVKECIKNMGTDEFSPDVMDAFEALSEREAVWLDVLYRPQSFLDYIVDDYCFTLDETLELTDFMSKIIDFRSPFTAMHSAGVAETAVCLAELLGMSEEECKTMKIAGYLHDLGKLKIPDSILEKPGKLTEEEFNIMKEHAYYSYILLSEVEGFEKIAVWAAWHHEKLNGKGYPFHLKPDEIPLGARIMTVADIFSAITEDRPYRRGMEAEQVIRILKEDVESGALSGPLVSLLIDNYDMINRRRDQVSRIASRKYQEALGGRDPE